MGKNGKYASKVQSVHSNDMTSRILMSTGHNSSIWLILNDALHLLDDE